MDPLPVTEQKPAEAVQITAAEIVAPMGERMPPLTEGAPVNSAPAFNNERPASDTSTAPLDSRKIRFSADRHQANADGTPKKNEKGNFILKTDYRKRHQTRGGESSAGSTTAAPQERPAPKFDTGRPVEAAREILPDEFDAAADMYLRGLAYGPIGVTFSEKAVPDEEEHKALKVSLAAWLRAKQITEPTPGWGFLLTALAVVQKKSEIPEVRERAGEVAGRFKRMFGIKPLPAIQPAR